MPGEIQLSYDRGAVSPWTLTVTDTAGEPAQVCRLRLDESQVSELRHALDELPRTALRRQQDATWRP
jgi:hypothetical protein